MTESHSFSAIENNIRSRKMPALFTRMSRSPNVSMALSTIRFAPAQSATLSPLTIASPPIALISATVCCAGVISDPEPSLAPPRSLTTTLAPCEANNKACSRPRPRPAPVIIATRPSSVPMVILLQVSEVQPRRSRTAPRKPVTIRSRRCPKRCRVVSADQQSPLHLPSG